MPDFSKARKGDICFSLRFGPGVVVDNNPKEFGDRYPVRVLFSPKGIEHWYTVNGRLNYSDITPDLYHSRPAISEPPPPKRTVKKWVAGFYDSNGRHAIWAHGSGAGMRLFSSEEEANSGCSELERAFVAEVDVEEE